MPRDGRNAYNRPIEGEPDTWDAADPHEKNDLAETPEGLAIAKRLFATLLELQKEKRDPLDLTKTFAVLAGGM